MPGMTPFRRSARADTKRSTGKGGRGNIYEKMRLPQTASTPILLIQAEYVDRNPSQDEVEHDPSGRPLEVKKPYFKVRKHKVAVNRGTQVLYLDEVCSAGFNPHVPEPCLGCYHIDQGNRLVGLSDVAMFGIVHLAYYHRHPLIDKQTGGLRMRQGQQGQQGDVMMVDDECAGRTCNYCRLLRGEAVIQSNPKYVFPNYRPQDITTFFGKRRYLETGKNHLQDILGWDRQIAGICGADGSPLLVDGYACSSCGGVLINMQNDPRTDDQIEEAVSRPYPCLTCNRAVWLTEVISCSVCRSAGREPIQFGLFDRVLHVQRQGEGTASKLSLMLHQGIDEFAANIPAQFLNNKTFREYIAEVGKPYDFEQSFKPRSLQDQARNLQLVLPASWAMSPPGQAGVYTAPNQPMQPVSFDRSSHSSSVPPAYPMNNNQQGQANPQPPAPAPMPGYNNS